MIKMVRLDERLIHGQIAIKWSRHTGVDRIFVVNDDAANNSIVAKSLLMAAPATCKTAIKGIDDAIRMLQDPRCDSLKILVVCSTPEDLLRIATEVKDIPLINVGNYGRIAPKHGEEARKTLRRNLYLYEDETAILKKVLETGIDCVYQTTPEEAPETLRSIIG